jgi:hypothetical protein
MLYILFVSLYSTFKSLKYNIFICELINSTEQTIHMMTKNGAKYGDLGFG